MKTLLENAIAHLLNGDENKAAALFHKFMVERARQIHESLRQDETDESLDENWDSEITEEEYLGDDDLADDDGTDSAIDAPDDQGLGDDVDGDVGDDAKFVGNAETEATDDVDSDDDDFADVDVDIDDDSETGVEGKIDDLSDKIDDLTAEFDRMMSMMHDDGVDDDGVGDDDSMGDDDGMDADGTDADLSADNFGEDAPDADADNDDLADRMEDDMHDDDEEPVAEGEKPDFLKKKEDEDEDADDDLKDITESVLAELEKIAKPANTDHKGVGSNSQPSTITQANNVSPVPHHNVMDRVKGEPVMTKGPTYDGFARQTPPPVKPSSTLVKNVRPGNRRNSYKDTMSAVPPKGDASAELNKDFAGGPKPTRSIVDGKTKKG